MPEYIKEMLQRDIDEKNQLKRAIYKLNILQIIVVIIGFGLTVSFFINTYFTRLAIQEVLSNRKETMINRTYGEKIIQKLDSIKNYQLKVK